MGLTGDLKIVVTSTSAQSQVVSVLLNNEKCGDNARKSIPPLILRGTPEELDEGFFTTIDGPIKQANGLMVDMEAWLKQTDDAKKQSAMDKDKTKAKPADKPAEKVEEKPTEKPVVEKPAAEKPAPEKPAIDPKKAAYDAAMQKSDALATEKKYREAIAKLPNAADYPEPEHAEILTKRKTELITLLNQENPISQLLNA